LRVAIGVLCGTTGGPATYGRRLVEALAAANRCELVVVTDRPDAFAAARCETFAVPFRGGADRLRWLHLALPRALAEVRPDLYHDTKHALPWRCRVPAVVSLHDLAFHRCPQTFPFGARVFLQRSTAHAVRRARAVLVPSRATAADVADIHPRAAAKVRCVPYGIAPRAPIAPAELDAMRARLGLTGRWILHVGTLQPRKNVDLLVRAVRLLRAEGFPHRLLLAGRVGWQARATLAEIERDDTARWLGEVSGEDLAALYASAEVFVSPSAYEGFGFTVGDALAAGVPAVISDISSLPELCGEAAVRIARLDAEGVAAAMRAVLNDAALRQRLAAAGQRRAAELDWARTAAGTLAVYEEVLAGARS
jgi:glycosyltransferase involved in cell wall biosynthesis